MFCLKCGAQNADGAKFCTVCGAPLMASQPSGQDSPQAEKTASRQPAAPPQEWPDSSAQGPVQAGGARAKGLSTGAVVAIVIGAVAIVAIVAAAFLLATGTISLGGGTAAPAQGAATQEDVAGTDDGEPILDDGEPVLEASGVAGTVFERAVYEQDVSGLADALEGFGLSISDSSAYHYDDMDDSLYVNLSGRVDAFPLSGADDDVQVTLSFEAKDFDFDWNEDDYATDCVSSLKGLPEDSVLSMVAFYFDADIEVDDFPDALATMEAALSIPGDISSISGTSSDLIDEACELLDISEDEGRININGDATYDCLYVDYESGYHLDITRYSSGSTEVSVYYYL